MNAQQSCRWGKASNTVAEGIQVQKATHPVPKALGVCHKTRQTRRHHTLQVWIPHISTMSPKMPSNLKSFCLSSVLGLQAWATLPCSNLYFNESPQVFLSNGHDWNTTALHQKSDKQKSIGMNSVEQAHDLGQVTVPKASSFAARQNADDLIGTKSISEFHGDLLCECTELPLNSAGSCTGNINTLVGRE